MTADDAAAAVDALLGTLWSGPIEPKLRAILPRDVASLGGFYPRLGQYVDDCAAHKPPRIDGTIDPAALVAGRIVATGEGSAIEAGAVIHESCRLILGARSRIRAGALLRDEVVIGDDCLIGAHCELARSVVLGPHTDFGHHIVFGDSIAGAGVLLSGLTGVANTHIHHDEEIGIRTRSGKVMTGRKYLGALIGDGARLGTNTAICPGTVIAPNLELPPGAVLLGVVDAERRDALMRDFFTRWAP